MCACLIRYHLLVVEQEVEQDSLQQESVLSVSSFLDLAPQSLSERLHCCLSSRY